MGKKPSRMRGFTLIASLLVLVLLSGIAIGLMFLVNSQQHVGSNDLEDNLAYYGAESGMEKATSDLSALYSSTQAPTPAQIANLGTTPPSTADVGNITYVENIAQQTVGGKPFQRSETISSGSEQGLSALIIPINMQVQATTPTGASVNMFRTVEVALIPVFQFGVFCDSDCSYFAGSQFNFAGPIHTNGNLFLASGAKLIASGKITAFGEVIRDRLANDHVTSAGYTGNVYVPNQAGGCAAGAPAAHCLLFAMGDASWTGGIPPAGAANADPTYATWISNAKSFNGFITNHINGAKKLSLPFVQGNNPALASSAQQIQIIREGIPADTVPVADSKLYNKAAIRIMLADTQALLHPDRPLLNDADDVNLAGNPVDQNGYQIQLTNAGGGYTRVGVAKKVSGGLPDPAWTAPPLGTAAYGNGDWNLVNGWIRVEYLNTANPPAWVGATRQWLSYGFARGINDPSNPVTGPVAGQNAAHPDAILILQKLKTAASPIFDTGAGNTKSEYSWYPVNFWDPREGLPRDAAGGLAGTQCTANGIMNGVELDVGNLNLWLQGKAPYAGGSGLSVNNTVQNGYVLYFSDRRGMLVDPNAAPVPAVNGEYGFEDVVNSGAGGAPDGVLEPITAGYNVDSSNGVTYSPEDSDQNGLLDNWGAANVGNGFGINTAGDPYKAVTCVTAGRNIVTGARHALKLVDGSLNNVPTKPDGSGGFTVASENPVYVQGDYNSNAGDAFWGDLTTDVPHAAAAVIADAVTLLSNNWTDQNSMANPLNLAARIPTTTHYRLAIAAGKNLSFPNPAGTGQDFGTDGGVHNFLRLLEAWGGGADTYYRGSLVSLYYSQYATGVFKCCNEVYGVPNRFFYFDSDFSNPNNLPPGTPTLQDINNLSEREDFTPQ
ncbi:MAG: PilX N-terminal domain-containing pilus assembly protein [Terriglobales bacterium]